MSFTPHWARVKKAHSSAYWKMSSADPSRRRHSSVQVRRTPARRMISRPTAIAGALADHRVQAPPVVRRDRLAPAVEVAQDDADAPEAAGVADEGHERDRFGQPRLRLVFVGVLRQARPARAAGARQVRHDHVVEQDVVQTARGQMRGVQMRVHVEQRDFPQPFFQRWDQVSRIQAFAPG